MNGAFYVGATGLQAQQRGLEVIANNVTNINTDTFKRSEIRFSELVATSPRTDDPRFPVSTPNEALVGVRFDLTSRAFEQGELKATGKPFDLAIDGDGFIEVLGPQGQVWLWRGGTVRVNGEGLLETESGLVLRALIDVPEESLSLSISREGVVTSVAGGSETATELGTILLAMPKDRQALEAIGGGYYRAADDADLETLDPGQENAGVIVQGSIETSNVDLSTEMVSLLLMQRAYAATAQVVQAGDQLMAIANGLRR